MFDKYTVLKQFFGHSAFRPGQEALIDAILSGRDALGVLPTGGGKSLCYQVPALLLPGVTLVISPLISLMNDQVRALKAKGIPAEAVSSAIPASRRISILKNAARGGLRLLYLAPERLTSPEFLRLARAIPISLLCVDEAHCVSQWGKDFRPAYLGIRRAVEEMAPRPRLAAFTATATPRVQSDIEALLGLREPFRLVLGFDRPNLDFAVLHPDDKWCALLSLLSLRGRQCGIVFCRTRGAAETLTGRLKQKEIPALCYHAGLPSALRTEREKRFLAENAPLMIATNAFGMGIDRPDVRFVIHYHMPADIESYYQEAGRAGRDGLPSSCILLADQRDVLLNRLLLMRSEMASKQGAEMASKQGAEHFGRAKWKRCCAERDHALWQMREYAAGHSCLRHTILTYFGEAAPPYCGRCSVCRARSRTSRTGRPPRYGSRPAAPPQNSPDPGLLRDLVSLRLLLAERRGILPYKIFPDPFLRDMAAARPGNLRELLVIEGAPVYSCIKYGAEFLREIRAWKAFYEAL